MASERDLELLDDYISNRLSAEDKAAFEQQLDADPALKSEYQLQNRIAESIRQVRAMELKTMLTNIPASALHGGEASVAGKAALWIAATVVTGTALYFYLKPEETSPVEPARQEVAHDSVAPAQEEIPQAEQATPATPENQDHEIHQNIQEQKKLADTPQLSPKRNDTVEKLAERPAIQAFDPSDEAADSSAPKTEITEGTTKVAKEASIPVQTDNSNKKYSFHYQVKDGRLYLYGPFEKNLYEIMEFFTENKRTIFLFHQNNYYLLNEDDVKVKPLTPINDPVLLKKLKEYRGK
jgi:hypothetical protein